MINPVSYTHLDVYKRQEVRRDEAVDYILTFEEIGSILDGLGIELEQVQEFSVLHLSLIHI